MMSQEKKKEFEDEIIKLRAVDQEILLRDREYQVLKSIRELISIPTKNGNEVYQFLPPQLIDLASEERILQFIERTHKLKKRREDLYIKYQKKYIAEYIKHRPTFRQWMTKKNATLLTDIKLTHVISSSVGDNLYNYVRVQTNKKYKTAVLKPYYYDISWELLYRGRVRTTAEDLLSIYSMSVSDLEESIFVISGHLFVPKKNLLIHVEFYIE